MSVSRIHPQPHTHSHIHKLNKRIYRTMLTSSLPDMLLCFLFSFNVVKVQPCRTKFTHNWWSHLLAVTEAWLSPADTAFTLSLEWKLFLPTLLFDLARLFPPFSFQLPAALTGTPWAFASPLVPEFLSLSPRKVLARKLPSFTCASSTSPSPLGNSL